MKETSAPSFASPRSRGSGERLAKKTGGLAAREALLQRNLARWFSASPTAAGTFRRGLDERERERGPRLAWLAVPQRLARFSAAHA